MLPRGLHEPRLYADTTNLGPVPAGPFVGQATMTFTIELYATVGDGTEAVLHRATLRAVGPLAARKAAHQFLTGWEERRAQGVRVLNRRGDTIWIETRSS
jgi:hypothetical protein